MVERGIGAAVAPNIAAALPEYMGPVFEAICRDWMWRQFASGGLGFEFTDIGRWWGNDPAIREEAEIDVVAVNGSETVLVGECKWRNVSAKTAASLVSNW
ncbi:MAG: DUF234 domain-containing protein [Eggerthellaceae bacterium]|nr:DUF234 domain-containing protein [Eggerthellaceae bacterium]